MMRSSFSRYYLWARAVPRSWVRQAVTLGPLAYWTKAPGTVGSAVGFVLYLLLFSQTGWVSYGALLALFLYAAVGLCEEGEIVLGRRDPGYIILDECVALPLCFWGIHGSGAIPLGLLWIIGLGLFRLFDITKPLQIGHLQLLPGGVGVVADDVAAAGLTWLILQVLQCF